MGREIKFRAVVSAEFVGEDKPLIVTAENDHHFSMSNCFGRTGLIDPNMDWVEERHYIVEQYTGLKDCNGVEIYEGDILECPDNQRYEVVFENGSFGIVGFDYDDHWYPEEFLLVGNIHEHGDLLK